MRILLVVSVALIGLFADPSSLFATLVYQYDFFNPRVPDAPDLPHGYIQFKDPSGEGGLDCVYDFSITSFPSPTRDYRGNEVPLIPAMTFRPGDVEGFSRTFSWDETHLSGTWSMTFNRFVDLGLFVAVDAATIQSFYPLEYNFNEAMFSGGWKFTGKRNVPEAGSTLLYLALGMIVLGSAGIKGLAWRNPGHRGI